MAAEEEVRPGEAAEEAAVRDEAAAAHREEGGDHLEEGSASCVFGSCVNSGRFVRM